MNSEWPAPSSSPLLIPIPSMGLITRQYGNSYLPEYHTRRTKRTASSQYTVVEAQTISFMLLMSSTNSVPPQSVTRGPTLTSLASLVVSVSSRRWDHTTQALVLSINACPQLGCQLPRWLPLISQFGAPSQNIVSRGTIRPGYKFSSPVQSRRAKRDRVNRHDGFAYRGLSLTRQRVH